MNRRMWITLGSATLLAAALGAAPSGTASAANLTGITCLTGAQVVTYSPGVTVTPTLQTITVHTDYQTCLSLSQPTIASGTMDISGQAVQSCGTLARTDTIAFSLVWRSGNGSIVGTSVVTADRTVTDAAETDLVTYTGSVTAGLFAGQPFVEQITYLAVDPLLQCLTAPGIQQRQSLANVTQIGI
ncbi:hypothetical protein [Hamadaea tsunoensis]|uniref:hypothetical protein n=1 Tax=Hamadaea tsunoensis TaxID=53368 RepID=UPI0003FBDF4B|nr:hypothetical protein [Hamadaea tsunoensis]